MRIQKVEAENFKLFTTKFQEIKEMDKADMVLFNGPNGYGKTSIFVHHKERKRVHQKIIIHIKFLDVFKDVLFVMARRYSSKMSF